MKRVPPTPGRKMSRKAVETRKRLKTCHGSLMNLAGVRAMAVMKISTQYKHMKARFSAKRVSTQKVGIPENSVAMKATLTRMQRTTVSSNSTRTWARSTSEK